MIAPASPTSSNNWGQFFQNLATQGAGIARAVLTPPAYQQTIGPGGTTTTIRNTATPSGALMAGTGVGLNSNTLLYVGGGLLAALLLVSVMKGRG
jgi:opacity protein-like surface antigen